MTTLKSLTLLLILNSCTVTFETEPEWDKGNLYKVKNVSSTISGDTTIVYLNDHSFIYYDEYLVWKGNYFIWKNKELLRDAQILKIRSIQDKRDMAFDMIYLPENMNEVNKHFDTNDDWRQISNLVLTSFDPTEIMNFRNAHDYINQYNKDYTGNFRQLFFDFSNCSDSCFASERIKLTGEMLYEVKLDHFWEKDKKVDADTLVSKLNKILQLKGVEKIKTTS